MRRVDRKIASRRTRVFNSDNRLQGYVKTGISVRHGLEHTLRMLVNVDHYGRLVITESFVARANTREPSPSLMRDIRAVCGIEKRKPLQIHLGVRRRPVHIPIRSGELTTRPS